MHEKSEITIMEFLARLCNNLQLTLSNWIYDPSAQPRRSVDKWPSHKVASRHLAFASASVVTFSLLFLTEEICDFRNLRWPSRCGAKNSGV